MSTAGMRRSWLVQRLNAPLNGRGFLGSMDNPLSFGGGLRNGGLSSEAMDLLRGVWSFDYMGAAEFEFGAVPKALAALAGDAKRLVASTITIRLSDVAPHWKERRQPAPDGEAVVYLLCRRKHEQEVRDRVRGFARDGHGADLKEPTRLSAALRPHDEWDSDTQGWFELDNGFLFFTSEQMWSRACGLFGVKVPSAAAS